jgi:hypothetical protein
VRPAGRLGEGVGGFVAGIGTVGGSAPRWGHTRNCVAEQGSDIRPTSLLTALLARGWVDVPKT